MLKVKRHGRRDWDYLKTTLFYELPVGEYFELEPQITYYGRFDRLEQQSGFNQYGPGVRLRFDNDKTKINAAIKYQIRLYHRQKQEIKLAQAVQIRKMITKSLQNELYLLPFYYF